MTTVREREILRLIRENPMLKQQEIAEQLGIARSSVAVYISNLVNKGYIEGRGYVVKERDYVTILGGANIDLIGISHERIINEDSNPGHVDILLGGVGRNQANYLRSLDVDVSLITAFGSDFNGDRLRHDCLDSGVDISNSIVVPNSKTSTYLSIIDADGTLHAGVNEMDIFSHLVPEILIPLFPLINRSSLCIVDTNIDEETIDVLVDNAKVPVFCETVSAAKAHRILKALPKIHTLRSDVADIEHLVNSPVNNEQELQAAIDQILSKGVKNIFIGLSDHEVMCASRDERMHLSLETEKFVSKSGARDSFMAAISWAYLRDYSFSETAKAGMASMAICTSKKNGIVEQLNESRLLETMAEIYKRK